MLRFGFCILSLFLACAGVDAADSYDLIIRNLSYADSGLYVCKQWNQKIIYYQLVVASEFFSSLNSFFFLKFLINLLIYINY